MAVRVTQFVTEVAILTAPPVLVTQFVLEVALVPTPPSITCGNPPPGTQGIAYSHTFPATGGDPPYTYSISAGELPPGLTLNASTGVASGTPTVSGTYVFTVAIVDSNSNVAAVQCSITISSIVKITLRGVKRRPAGCQPEGDLQELPTAPHVKRAI